MSFANLHVGEENRFSKYIPESYLAHHGILGQKWGVRRFQNPDGTLTAAGRERYGNNLTKRSIKAIDQQLKDYMDSGSKYTLEDEILKKHIDKIRDTAKITTKKYEDPDAYKDIKGYNEAVSSGDFKNVADWMWENPKEADKVYKIYDNIIKTEMKPVLDAYINDYRVNMLKDLGYEPTQKALDWLNDHEKQLKYYFMLYPDYHGAYDWVGD